MERERERENIIEEEKTIYPLFTYTISHLFAPYKNNNRTSPLTPLSFPLGGKYPILAGLAGWEDQQDKSFDFTKEGACTRVSICRGEDLSRDRTTQPYGGSHILHA